MTSCVSQPMGHMSEQTPSRKEDTEAPSAKSVIRGNVSI